MLIRSVLKWVLVIPREHNNPLELRSRGLLCSLGMTKTQVFNTYQIHVYCDEKLINLRLINKTFRTRTTFRVGCSETGEGCV